MILPIDEFILMLDIEEPDSNRARKRYNRQLQHKERFPTYQQAHCCHERDNQQIGDSDAVFLTVAAALVWKSLTYQENKQGSDDEQNNWVSKNSVSKSSPRRGREVLFNRERPDISNAAPIKIAGGRMMPRVISSPVLKRCEGEKSRNITENSVCVFVGEERAMTTIMEEDKNSNFQSACNGNEREESPVAEFAVHHPEHDSPCRDERGEGVDDLPDRSHHAWLLVE